MRIRDWSRMLGTAAQMPNSDSDRDLTEPTPLPARVRVSGERSQADLLNLAFDAIFVRSLRDREITFWNRGAEELYGWPASEALGRDPGDLLKTQYPRPLEEIEWDLLATGRWEGELVQVDRAGRRIVVAGRWALRRDERGEPVEVLEINSDDTERRRALEELRSSEERFRLLVEGVPDYAIYMLDPRGHITSWNRGAERIKGYTAAQAMGKHFSLFYPKEDILAGRPQQDIDSARRHGGYEGEGWRVRQDGERFWAHITITPLYDASGAHRGFAKITRDATERKRAEDQLLALERDKARAYREYAERTAALERAKSNFLNLASHELRGPLTVISGYLSMLAEGALGQLSPEGQDKLPLLQSKAAEMNRLVDKMLELARLEDSRLELKLSRNDLTALVREVVARLAPAAAGRTLELDLPAEPLFALIDADRVNLIVANLVDNAIKYSSPPSVVAIRLVREQDHAVLTVSDQGIGISEEARRHLFTRFGRISNPATAHISGTGLGLYLCRELAIRHGGSVDVVSVLGQGSTFTLRLPIGEGEEGSSPGSPDGQINRHHGAGHDVRPRPGDVQGG